jgi:DNA-binding PadR family transcriptional regulator
MAQTEIDNLLLQWEETYKKGLLSFWLMLLVHKRPTYAYEMREAIVSMSQGTILVDEKSIYRALKRFEETGLISSEKRPSDIGPPRRYFSLTETGEQLLAQFIQRNVYIFQQPAVAALIEAVTPLATKE